MADIFISYAKTDRPLALKLAAMLEAEGWTTWWDTSLTIGDDFRNEIMTELGRARAVIVIWTDTSIKSDWVRSEAVRARRVSVLVIESLCWPMLLSVGLWLYRQTRIAPRFTVLAGSASCFALAHVRDLFLCAKYLSVDATADRGQRGWLSGFSYFLDVIAG